MENDIVNDNKVTKSTKSKALSVLFKCTFIPYGIFILITLVIGCLTGINFFGYVEPGFEALEIGFYVACFLLIVIPIIPVCFIIQMTVLIRNIVSKKRAKDGKKTRIAPFVISAVAVGVLSIGGMFAYMFKDDIVELFDKQRAQLFYRRAEQVVPYDKWIESTYIFNDSRFQYFTMMADWDSYTLGFVFEDPFAEYEVVKLKKTSREELDKWFEHEVSEREQLKFTFDNGNVLTTYTASPEEYSYQNTVLFLVETPDGELYSASNIGLFYGLKDDSFSYTR